MSSKLRYLKQATKELETFLATIRETDRGYGASRDMISWKDYMSYRGLSEWASQPFVSDQPLTQPAAKIDSHRRSEETNVAQLLRSELLSKVLSFPLTAYGSMQKLQLPRLNTDSRTKALDQEAKPTLTLCIVGARAEATLPPLYWKELLLLCPQITCLNLVFVGPEVPKSKQSKHVYCISRSTSSLDTAELVFQNYQSTFQDVPSILKTAKLEPDLLCFFNSGIGSYSLETDQAGWNYGTDFIDLFKQLNLPACFTSFNRTDYDADATSPIITALSQAGFKPLFIDENPFASHWEEPSTFTGKRSTNEPVYINKKLFLLQPDD